MRRPVLGGLLTVGLMAGAAGCFEEDVADCEGWDPEYWHSGTASQVLGEGEGAMAWRVVAEEPGDALKSVTGDLWVANPTDHDCLVAVYQTEGLVALPEGVGPIDPEDPPPEVHPVLGQRLLLVNLAAARSSVDNDHVSLSVEPDSTVDATLTVLGCAEGGIEAEVELWADYCDTTSASGYWSREVYPESFELTAL